MEGVIKTAFVQRVSIPSRTRARGTRTEPECAARERGVRGIYLALLVGLSLRIPQLRTGVHPDEAEYAYVARWWARGARLYEDAFVDRPQLLLATFRVLGVFGSFSPTPLRIFAMLWGSILIVSVAWLIRELGGSWTSAAAGALLTSFYTSLPFFDGHVLNGELLAAVPSTLCVAICARSLRTNRRELLFLAGVVGGCAILFKQSGIDGVGAVALWIVIAKSGENIRDRLRRLLVLSGGVLLPIAVAVLHGFSVGIGRWWYAMLGYRLQQSGMQGSDARLDRLASSIYTNRLILVGLALALLCAVRTRPRRIGLAWVWLGLGVLAFLAGGSYWNHYYLGIFPALCAILGLAFGNLGSRSRFGMGGLVALVMFAPVLLLGTRLVSSVESEQRREMRALGEFVRQHVPTNDRIVSFGGNLEIALSDRLKEPLSFTTVLGEVVESKIPATVERLERREPRWILVRNLETWPASVRRVKFAIIENYRSVKISGNSALLERREVPLSPLTTLRSM